MELFKAAFLIGIFVLTTMETLFIINEYKLKKEVMQYMEDNCPKLDVEMRRKLVEGAFIDTHTSIIVIIALLIIGFYLIMTGVM